MSVQNVDSLVQFWVNYFLNSNSVRVEGPAASSPVLAYFLSVDCVVGDIAGILEALFERLLCSFNNLVFHITHG